MKTINSEKINPDLIVEDLLLYQSYYESVRESSNSGTEVTFANEIHSVQINESLNEERGMKDLKMKINKIYTSVFEEKNQQSKEKNEKLRETKRGMKMLD